jgi:hypothetical protein
MDDSEVIKRFAVAERKFTIVLVASFILFFSTFILEKLGFGYINPAFGFLSGIIIFTIGALKIYKCPKCGSMPKALGAQGIQMSPKSCGNCGVKLR